MLLLLLLQPPFTGLCMLLLPPVQNQRTVAVGAAGAATAVGQLTQQQEKQTLNFLQRHLQTQMLERVREQKQVEEQEQQLQRQREQVCWFLPLRA
jgi:hypothetical protein